MSLSPTEMIEMMVLDSCFIIELILKYSKPDMRDKDDPILKMGGIIMTLQCDVMLLENQLSFFIIYKLYDIIMDPN